MVSRGEIGTKLRGPSAQTFGTSIVAQAFIAVTGIVAARALGVEGRGTLALLWLLPAMLALLGGLGIPQATTYYVAREGGGERGVVRLSLGITLVLAGVISVLYGTVLAVAGGDGPFSAVDGVLSVVLLPLLMIQNLAVATLLGLSRYRGFNITRLAPSLLYFIGAATLFAAGAASLTSILAACVASWAIAIVGSWLLIRRALPNEKTPPAVTRSGILGFGLRGVIGTVSPIDDVRIDQLVVGLLLDSRALGLYVSAVAFVNLPRFFAQSIGSVNYPRVAGEADPARAWHVAARAAKIGVVGIAVIVAVLIIALPHLLPLLFGSAFEDAVGIGYVLLAAAYFLSIHRLLTELARGLGHPGYGSVTELVNVVVFFAALFVTASPASATGVATAVLAGGISSALLLSSMLVVLRRKQLEGGN
jgi:O-antigen/teichoic acid export membrane protein